MTTAATFTVHFLCVIEGSFFCSYALSQDLCVFAMPRRRAHLQTLLCHSTTFIRLFCHLRISTTYVNCQATKVNHNDADQSPWIIDWCVWCNPKIDCIEKCDWLYSVHPKDIEWKLLNRENLVPCPESRRILCTGWIMSWLWFPNPPCKHYLLNWNCGRPWEVYSQKKGAITLTDCYLTCDLRVCDRTNWSSSTWWWLHPPGTLSLTNSSSKHMILNATSGTHSVLWNWKK